MSVANLESHITESLLEYLLNIIQDDDIANMSKLASMTVLNKFFKTDADHSLKYRCVQADLVCSLLMALDTGLSQTCQPYDTVYVKVAMEIMWEVSKMPICQLSKVISEVLIRSLLMYLDVDGEFYRFPQSMKQHMKTLCENKHLIGRVRKVPMATEPLEYIHKHTQNQLKRLTKLPDTVQVCELYDTASSDTDLNISQLVLDEKLAWAGCIPGAVSKTSEPVPWQDVIVTEMREGGIFWAHVGEDTVKRVSEVQAELNKGGLERVDRVLKGECVAVFGKIQDTPCFLRAQVLKVKESAVDVVALDYGCTMSVDKTEIYTLPEDLELMVWPQCASLCTIAGIQAPPFDIDLVGSACAILNNLCKQSRSACEILEKLGGIDILDKLLQKCRDIQTLTQAIILVNNLCCNANMSPFMTETNILQSVLDAASNNMEKESLDTELLTACMSCLINLLYDNVTHRQLFYQKQGIDVTLKVVCNCSRTSQLYQKATKLLRIFIGSAVLGEKKNVPIPNKKDDRNPNSTRNRISIDAETLVSRRRNHTKIDDLRNSIVSRKEAVTEEQPCQSVLSKVEKHYPVDSSDDESVCGSSRTLRDPEKDDRFYIRDNRVDFDDDLTHEIRPNKEVFTISHMSIAPHVCAMLNSGNGGVIYLGIGKDRRIFGLEMNRDERDEFRLGIDRLMHRKIYPILLHSHFDVKLVPVLDPDQHSILRDLYVVEISITAAVDTIYTTDDKCFYRFAATTSPVNPLELRHLVVLEVESEYNEKLVRLKAERDRLKKSKQLESEAPPRGRQDGSSDS